MAAEDRRRLFDKLAAHLETIWYHGRPPGFGLRLMAGLYALVYPLNAAVNRSLASRPAAPLIVVGNLTAGGTGKTPLVVRLLELLARAGMRPGVVSRGYRSKAGAGPVAVSSTSTAAEVGDEPLMIYRRSRVPVVVGSRRVRAVQLLCRRQAVDVIVSDDGLQHYRMGRDLEIAVIDGERLFGNGRLQPAGPLREPLARLRTVDYVVVNGGAADTGQIPMTLELGSAVNLVDGRRRELAEFAGETVIAMAGIGHPERFFRQLEGRGLRLERRAFGDHHDYRAGDLTGSAGRTVLMTEKDAVKLSGYAGANCWYVAVDARLPASFEDELVARLVALRDSR